MHCKIMTLDYALANQIGTLLRAIKAQQGVSRLLDASSILVHHPTHYLPQLICLFQMFSAYVLNTYFLHIHVYTLILPVFF